MTLLDEFTNAPISRDGAFAVFTQVAAAVIPPPVTVGLTTSVAPSQPNVNVCALGSNVARLHEFQALWVKEMQRNVLQTYR